MIRDKKLYQLKNSVPVSNSVFIADEWDFVGGLTEEEI